MQTGRGYSKLLVLLSVLSASAYAGAQQKVETWLTTPDRSALLARQSAPLVFAPVTGKPDATITVDSNHALQTIDGFGFALTGGSAQLLMQMSADRRAELLQEFFGKGSASVHVSYLRITVGASDMNDHVYTYDDMAPGETDLKLKSFSLAPDEVDVIPIMKQILAIDPKIRIMATPWTAPSWMKTSDKPKAGHLKPEFYDVYAQYLVRYLKEMKAQGIPIDAMTLQNEPLNTNNTPSMEMPAVEEAAFLKTAFGPLLRRSKLTTKVILYDHNCDVPEYPMSILEDAEAAKYADGSGFHLYGGSIAAMSKVHDAYPAKNLYFTEQMVIDDPKHSAVGDPLRIAPPVERVVIGSLSNWSRNVLLWNLAADPHNGPHTADGGCPVCEGAITLDHDTVTRNLAYYTIAQISRFVPPGSERIESNSTAPATLAEVAFRTPEGKLVLLVANTAEVAQSFAIRSHEETVAVSLGAGAVATYVW